MTIRGRVGDLVDLAYVAAGVADPLGSIARPCRFRRVGSVRELLPRHLNYWGWNNLAHSTGAGSSSDDPDNWVQGWQQIRLFTMEQQRDMVGRLVRKRRVRYDAALGSRLPGIVLDAGEPAQMRARRHEQRADDGVAGDRPSGTAGGRRAAVRRDCSGSVISIDTL